MLIPREVFQIAELTRPEWGESQDVVFHRVGNECRATVTDGARALMAVWNDAMLKWPRRRASTKPGDDTPMILLMTDCIRAWQLTLGSALLLPERGKAQLRAVNGVGDPYILVDIPPAERAEPKRNIEALFDPSPSYGLHRVAYIADPALLGSMCDIYRACGCKRVQLTSETHRFRLSGLAPWGRLEGLLMGMEHP